LAIQENYVLKVLERFNMAEVRLITTTLASYFKLSSKQCPQSPEEEEEMSRIPYASAVGSLMYAMVCTKLDLAYAVSTVSHSCQIQEATLGSSEVGATIFTRDCDTRLGVSKIENGEA